MTTTRQFGVGMVVAVLVAAQAGWAADAAATYAKSCASCHGKDGKGNPKMAKALKVDIMALDLTDAATRAKPDAALIKVTADGVGKTMPAYGKKLKPEEIAALIAYVRTLAPK